LQRGIGDDEGAGDATQIDSTVAEVAVGGGGDVVDAV
jgi:hypothetical protein